MKRRKKGERNFRFFWEDDSWDEMDEFGSRIENMMREMMRTVPSVSVSVGNTFPVDVKDEGDKLKVFADLPGFSKKDISVEVTEKSIKIEAKRSKEKIQHEESFFRRERAGNVVRRAFTLPCRVDPDRVRAKFDDGVLQIELPKVESKKEKKRVDIQ